MKFLEVKEALKILKAALRLLKGLEPLPTPASLSSCPSATQEEAPHEASISLVKVFERFTKSSTSTFVKRSFRLNFANVFGVATKVDGTARDSVGSPFGILKDMERRPGDLIVKASGNLLPGRLVLRMRPNALGSLPNLRSQHALEAPSELL